MLKDNNLCIIKPPKTFNEQIEILKSRNLKIKDEVKSKRFLKRVNYYRFSAYMLSLKKDDIFYSYVDFEDICDLYQFDKGLRNLLIGIIEDIEISFRTHLAYHHAHKYGPLGYMKSKNFEDKRYHDKFLIELETDIEKRKDELYVQHHIRKYGSNFPIWVAIETVSFTCLSKLFNNLKVEDKSYISKEYYGIPYVYIGNWLHVLSYIRNICAHYGRLYNKRLSIKVKLGNKDKALRIQNDRIFSPIYILKKLALDKEEYARFIISIATLLELYKVVDLDLIGFPKDWYNLLES